MKNKRYTREEVLEIRSKILNEIMQDLGCSNAEAAIVQLLGDIKFEINRLRKEQAGTYQDWNEKVSEQIRRKV